jgi:copper resistance protein C
MNPRLSSSRHRAAPILLLVTLALAFPAGVSAHAELETADPPDGAVLSTPPAAVVLTFTEGLDASKSSLTLHDPSGAKVADGAVDAAAPDTMRLVTPSSMAPGTYEIRWTAAAADGHVENDTLHFELTAPTPSPTPSPTPRPTVEPSAEPTPSPTPSPTATPAPSPSTTPAGGTGADQLLPILAALVVIGVLGGMLLRGRLRGGGPA